MNALNRFLRSAESRALDERVARLASARSLKELPDTPIRRDERAPPETRAPLDAQAVYRARQEENVTIAELAERFEVNARTIFRVLRCARAAGRGTR